MKLLAPAINGISLCYAQCTKLISQKKFSHYCYLNPVTIEFYELEDSMVFYIQFGYSCEFSKMFKILDVS